MNSHSAKLFVTQKGRVISMRQITVPARIERLDDIFDFVESMMRNAGIDSNCQNNIKIAVEEIFVNIASYAYQNGDGEVSVCADVGSERFSVEFRDSGNPYNPLERTDPDISLSAQEREIGGLGILMVKKMMDNVKYRYENGMNILTIEKIIEIGKE